MPPLRSSHPFSTRLIRLARASNCPARPLAPAWRAIEWSGQVNSKREMLRAEAVEKMPHSPHQYCSLTWWKAKPANIFHHVIGREDQMPWLDMPTLLTVQMMTQSSLHYLWLLWRRRRSLRGWKAEDVQASTSRSCWSLAGKKKWQKFEHELLLLQRASASVMSPKMVRLFWWYKEQIFKMFTFASPACCALH